MIQYPSQDGTQINAYLSRPAAAGRYPGVVVIMEAFGLIDHIKDVARRFAEQGYLALAPDMYTREGSPDPSHLDSVLQTMFSVPDTQAVADLEGAIAHLKRLPDSNGKVGGHWVLLGWQVYSHPRLQENQSGCGGRSRRGLYHP